MSQRMYPVACGCGVVHQCPAGYAGSKFACQCGKTIEVPSLTELRRLPRDVTRQKPLTERRPEQRRTPVAVPRPETLADAELEIGSRLRRGTLPVESACVLCQSQTFNAVPISVVCERERYGTVYWCCLVLLIPPLTPIGLFILLRSQLHPARDVVFRLPVRVCESCQPTVFTLDGANQALRATPLYARLLNQYQAAVVSAAGVNHHPPVPGTIYRQRERRLLSRLIGICAGFVVWWGVMIGGMVLIDAVVFPAADPNGMRARWAGLSRVGMVNIAAVVGILAGVGITRFTAGLHRHFWPDPEAE